MNCVDDNLSPHRTSPVEHDGKKKKITDSDHDNAQTYDFTAPQKITAAVLLTYFVNDNAGKNFNPVFFGKKGAGERNA